MPRIHHVLEVLIGYTVHMVPYKMHVSSIVTSNSCKSAIAKHALININHTIRFKETQVSTSSQIILLAYAGRQLRSGSIRQHLQPEGKMSDSKQGLVTSIATHTYGQTRMWTCELSDSSVS